MNKSSDRRLILRYTASQRINHWLIAISFVLLALSGLALFHPAFSWMAQLFGGGTWTRILHPFVGVFMVICFAVFAARMWRNNLPTRQDVQWFRQIGDVLGGRDEKLPEVGRYNAGQKALYFAMILFLIVLLLSGVVMWRSYFSSYFSVGTIRLASLLHALFAFLMICGIIVHVYAGFWVKGSVRAMTRGTVTPGWAWKHHRAWFRQLRGKREPTVK